VRISDFVALTLRHKKASQPQGGRNKKGTIMQKKNDLFVITKAKDLAKYIITVAEKSPVKYRFTLIVRLQNYILDVLENLYLANNTKLGKQRRQHQETAKTQLSMLDYFAGLAAEQSCILFKQYEQISKQQAECLLFLNKWIASDAKRTKVSPDITIGDDIG
jgi:hypothetical protein